MKTWQILVAPAVLLLVVVIQQAQVAGGKNQQMDAQPVPKIEMLQPVRIENGHATAEALVTYVDGRAERCTFEMEVIRGTGVAIEGFTLRPRHQKCLPATQR
jgi:hypothetical protein